MSLRRKLTYRLRIPISRVRRRVRLLADGLRGKKRLHMLHIRKTGGTAIRAALKHAHPKDYSPWIHGHYWRLEDVPVGEQVFFFVRDPVSRFVSGFNDRLRKGLPRYLVEWTAEEAVAFARFHSPNELAEALSSPDREAACAAMRGIRHVNSSYWDWFGDEDYFRSRVADVFYIGFQERLEEDFQVIASKLGVDAHLPRTDRDAHRTPAGYETHLSPLARRNLMEWFARDIAFIELCREIAVTTNASVSQASSKEAPISSGP